MTKGERAFNAGLFVACVLIAFFLGMSAQSKWVEPNEIRREVRYQVCDAFSSIPDDTVADGSTTFYTVNYDTCIAPNGTVVYKIPEPMTYDGGDKENVPDRFNP